ncbi:MAG: 50S ribosomal protein L22 [Candidatus Dojkabacteria bacterium]
MEVIATAKYNNVRIGSRKLRLVADLVRGMSVEEAVLQLENLDKKAAGIVLKTLNSAVANAKDKSNAAAKDLAIGEIFVTEAMRYKRGRAVSRGRYFRITKPGSNLTIKLTAYNGK